jgi:hypothetical protein
MIFVERKSSMSPFLVLILAFPMLTSLKIVMEHLEATKGWAVLMSDE